MTYAKSTLGPNLLVTHWNSSHSCQLGPNGKQGKTIPAALIKGFLWEDIGGERTLSLTTSEKLEILTQEQIKSQGVQGGT